MSNCSMKGDVLVLFHTLHVHVYMPCRFPHHSGYTLLKHFFITVQPDAIETGDDTYEKK